METPAPSPRSALQEGQPVPSFELSDQEGRPYTFPSGQPTILLFYRGFW